MSVPLPTPTVRAFSASAAAQLMQCPGSARLEEAIPGFVHPVRDDMAGAKGVGTRLHEQLYAVRHLDPRQVNSRASILLEWSKQDWRLRRKQCDDIVEMKDWLDTRFPGLLASDVGLAFVEWMTMMREYPPRLLRWATDALYVFANIIAEAKRRGAPLIYAEKKVHATWLVGGYPTTPDIVVYAGGYLWVLDYKSGKIPVSAIDNDQLLYYAACYVEHFEDVKHVSLVVTQPGAYSAWEPPVQEVRDWMERAKKAEQRLLDKDLTLRPSDKCTFCPANPHSRGDKGAPLCPAMMEMLYPPVIDELAILSL